MLLAGIVMLRGLVAPGFMPELSSVLDGRLVLVICGADGVSSDGDGGRSPAHTHDPCPYGMVAAAAIMTTAVGLPSPRLQVAERLVEPLQARHVSAAKSLFWARGPPLAA